MIKRLLIIPISTTVLRRVFQVIAVIVAVGCVVTLLIMAGIEYSFGAVLLAAIPYVLVKVALMILVLFQDRKRFRKVKPIKPTIEKLIVRSRSAMYALLLTGCRFE